MTTVTGGGSFPSSLPRLSALAVEYVKPSIPRSFEKDPDYELFFNLPHLPFSIPFRLNRSDGHAPCIQPNLDILPIRWYGDVCISLLDLVGG